jgi:hypothetical protein
VTKIFSAGVQQSRILPDRRLPIKFRSASAAAARACSISVTGSGAANCNSTSGFDFAALTARQFDLIGFPPATSCARFKIARFFKK